MRANFARGMRAAPGAVAGSGRREADAYTWKVNQEVLGGINLHLDHHRQCLPNRVQKVS